MDPAPLDVPADTPPDPACAACGYSLRGVAAGGRCPECGWQPVAGLTRREAVLVGLRLIAVGVAASGLLLLDLLVFLVLDAVSSAFSSGAPVLQRGSFLVFQIGPLLVRFALAAVLWWWAPWLTRRLVPKDGPVFAGRAPAAADLLTVGLVLLGVHFAVGSAAALAIPAFASLSPDTAPLVRADFVDAGLLRLLLQLALGVLLAACRPLHRGLARWVVAAPDADSGATAGGTDT